MSNDTAFVFDISTVPADVLEHMAERVELAAGVLDSLKPEWRSLVDVNTLDMESVAKCMLGQVFGDFHEGLRKFKVQARENGIEFSSYDVAQWFGFASGWTTMNDSEKYISSDLLRHVWSEQVNNGSPLTMRDRLLSSARATVARFEKSAEDAKRERENLVADFDRVAADYKARIEKATNRAEQAAATASEARSEFDALTAESSK